MRKKLVNELLSFENNNPTEFWKLIKKMQKWGKSTDDPADGIPPSDWQSHFQKLLNSKCDTPQEKLDELARLESEINFSELDEGISNNEISNAFKKLNLKSSVGPDLVSGKLLHSGKDVLMPLLFVFYNRLFELAKQPKIFASNFLVSIPKKGDLWDLDNYRGIAIGSALAKLYCLILLNRLEERAAVRPISPNQIGFEKGHRTGDHVFVLTTVVNKFLKVEKKRLFVAFIDFRKAYDKINRNLLLLKLQKRGIKGKFYQNLKAIYSDISYVIKVKGGYLDPIPSTCGLKQGGVLSPSLFNIFIDDIKDLFDASCDPVDMFDVPLSHLLYADDLILMSTSMDGLNKCLEKLRSYCNTWQMEVNIKKSQVMVFNASGRLLTGYNFFYGDKRLEQVKTYCYLGIEISCSGSFGLARSSLVEKAKKATFPLKALINQFQLPVKKSLDLYNSLISPILLYNAENLAHLSHKQIADLEENKKSMLEMMMNTYMNGSQYKFLKYVLGVKSNCSNLATLGEMGEFPLILRAWTSVISFWHRTTMMDDRTFAKKAVKHLMENDIKESEWISTVRFILKSLGLERYFIRPSLITQEKLKEVFIKTFQEKFVQEWSTSIASQSGSLRFYKKFKSEFAKEKYLDDVKCFQLRKIIAKFRCSDHRLEIEAGRHKKVEESERRCKICMNGVECETHFISDCPVYRRLRLKHFGPNVRAKLIDIMKCDDKTASFNLANFLTKAYNLREYCLRMRSYFN